MSVSAELEAEVPGSAPLFGPSDKLGIPADLPFDGLSKGAQHFPVAAPEAIVGHSHMHMAARSQVQACCACLPLSTLNFTGTRDSTHGHIWPWTRLLVPGHRTHLCSAKSRLQGRYLLQVTRAVAN